MEWTEKARQVLEEYCTRSRAALDGSGADAAEVIEDLRRHVDEELLAARLSIVTEDDVKRILDRLGKPAEANRPATAPDSVPPALPEPRRQKRSPGFMLLFLGVVLPGITLVFEWITGASAGILFDPIPNWFQLGAVALVPAANLWIWLAGRSQNAAPARRLGWANGVALGISLFYSLCYLPFFPFACMGILFFGLGFIPLSPHLALLATFLLRRRYRERIETPSLTGGWRGCAAAFLVLAAIQVPAGLTYYALSKAGSENPADRQSAIRLLRRAGDREIMLRACYGMLQRELGMDPVRIIATRQGSISADTSRETYFRVTGKPFNSVPPPSLYTRAGRWNEADEDFAWDDALGGETVAGRVKGLSLLSSRMDATAEPDAALVYCEWTLEFKNISRVDREARAQIALPPGGVVSRVTLWINGEEREAAFGGRSQTREAYQNVAVAQRRDPVLVTTCGPDRVLLQCFPIRPNGGTMKVRVGITAPVLLSSIDSGRFAWPFFLERNFRIDSTLKTARWIESPQPLISGKSAAPEPASGLPYSIRESATAADVTPVPVEIRRNSLTECAWVPSPGEPEPGIRQTILPEPPAFPDRLIVVVDGSEGMGNPAQELAAALAGIPESVELSLIVASDVLEPGDSTPQKASAAAVANLQKTLTHLAARGGQDNLPALEQAWDLAAAAQHGAVLWIHAPQPVLLSSESGLQQRLERSPRPTRLYELQVGNGPNRIAEKLDGRRALVSVPRMDNLESDVKRLLDRWRGRIAGFSITREPLDSTNSAGTSVRASRHVQRLWARDQAARLVAKRQRDEAVQLASNQQLVTPVTGAVVLETKAQYDQFKLNPADPATVPSIPEPGVPGLLGLGILVWAYARKAAGKTRKP